MDGKDRMGYGEKNRRGARRNVMKVWEKCNEVKGTNATIEEIASWAYNNRICPMDFDVGLEIDLPLDKDGIPLDNGFAWTAHRVCESFSCGKECLMAYLNSEYLETI